MQIKKNMEFVEKYLPTPRCRKWRTRFVQGEFTAEIREAALSDAPVVLKVHDYETYAEGLHTTDYRLYDGKLYVQARYGLYHNCERSLYMNPVTVADDLNRLMICGTRANRESVAAEYQHEADKLLILDGIVWIKATEPFYSVQCFGLGGNHGGTALMIDRNWHHAFDEDTYSALEREIAVKEAVQIAKRRGDTDSIAHIQNNAYRIEVIDPSVIKFHRQPRIFQAERIVTSTVNVKTYSYSHAIEIAKKLPESCFVQQNVSWRNNGEVDCDEAFCTEANVMAQSEQPQEESGPSLSDMMEIAAGIAKTLENCDFDDCTDSTGYIVIRDFGNEVSRVVDVYKYNGNGADTPHYVIYRRYEDGNADYVYTDDLTVEGLAEELEEFYNEPYEDLKAATEAVAVTAPVEPQNADDGLEICKMLTLSSAHITEDTQTVLVDETDHSTLSGLCVYPKADCRTDYGFFIYIDKEEFLANIENDDCPEDLFAVVKYAIAHGCSVLCLDSDGKMVVRDLPIYEY